MGSGNPRSNVRRSSGAVDAGGASGGGVIRCDIQATVSVTVLVRHAASVVTGVLAQRDGEVVVLNGSAAVAVLDSGEIVDRLRSCMAEGFEYAATLDTSAVRPIASVAPSMS